MFFKSILLKRGLRTDKIWTNPLLLRKPFRMVPMYLDTQALLRSQYWPREELKKVSLERFTNIVRHAYTIPFWKERFDRAGIDPHNFRESDIARIPILTKKDFLGKEVKEYTASELLKKSHQYYTSGSTGQPFRFFHDEKFELRAPAIAARMFLVVGNGECFPTVLLKSRLHGGFGKSRSFFFVRSYNDIHNRLPELKKLVASFNKSVILYGVGSSVLELARVCRDTDTPLALKCVVYTGEELNEIQRQEIKISLKTEVRSAYGVSEIRQPAFECEQQKLHITEEVAYFEVVDDNGASSPTGVKGRLLITGFENHVMPFIRYDTGDIGVIDENLCVCGRTLRTVKFIGRQTRLLDVGSGRTVSLLNFSVIFDRFSWVIRRYQIIRTEQCAFTIYLVTMDQVFDTDAKRKIIEEFQLNIHPKVQVTWVIVDKIEEGANGKALYFIDEYEKKAL